MTSVSGFFGPCEEAISAPLTGAHDLDRVAGFERRAAPCRTRNHRAVDRNGYAPLIGVDVLAGEQRHDVGGNERFVFAVDADHRARLVLHGTNGVFSHLFPYSAARAGANRSMPKGRIAGSISPPSARLAMASAVIGAS